jgi:uncharacterized repeat protein (TIGR01451 family)
LDLSWTAPPTSVGNGEPLRGTAHVNLNDSLGATGTEANHVVMFKASGGVFTRLPSACRTDGDPVSEVSTDGSQVRCNLGQVTFGTAIEADFTVTAHAADGEAVRVELTDGTATRALPPIPVTASPGIDVVFNESQRIQATSAWDSVFPVALALPVGSADLSGPISFDVVVTDKTSTNAPSALTASQKDCLALDSSTPPSSMPKTSPQAPVPTTCTVVQSAPGVFHVVVDGYRTPAAVDPPTVAADGSSLPTDRHYFAAFGLPLASATGVLPASASFELTVTHVAATTSAGASVAETDTTNNTESVAVVPPGGYAHNWAHPTAFGAPMDSRVVGGGGGWAATYYATPGDQIVTNTTDGIWGGVPESAVPNGAEWSMCEVLDGPATFTGDVIANVQPTSAGASAPIAGGTYTWSIYTGPLPAQGSRDAFDCGSVPFTTVTSSVLNHAGDVCACTAEERLTVGNPAAITAIKLTVDPRKLAAVSALDATPTRIGMHAAVRLAPTATPSDDIWTLGSVNDRSGAWKTSSDLPALITPTPGLRYAGTDSLRDVMRILGARPYVHKSVSQPDVRAGDVVTYTLQTGAEANLGAGTASWTLTDDLPAGLDYLDGSASMAPGSVTRNPDGSTRLSWSLSGPVNTDKVISYRSRISFTSGVRRNTAVATIGTGSSANGPAVQTDEDSADVAYAGDGRTILTKTSGSSTFAAGGSDTWTLQLANLDTVDQERTDIIDVLPWNGDARGSSFHGSFAVDSVISTPGDTIYYSTASPASIATDPNAPANGSFAAPSAMWSPSAPADRTSVTAIRVVGSTLVVGAQKSTTIAWHQVDGRSGDHFENIAYAKASHTVLQMIKAAATSTVADGSRLQIAKRFVSASGWAERDSLHYVVTVHNPSTSVAHDITVHDLGGNGNDPGSVMFSVMGQGTFDSETRTWDIGDLAAGQTVKADLTTTIPANSDRSREFDNLAYVENPSNPYEPSTNATCQRNNQDVLADTDQCDRAAVAPPHLRIDKHADSATADGVVTWTIRVRVDGTVGARDISVEDTLPAGLVRSTLQVVGRPSRGSVDLARATWDIGDLAPGEVATLTYRGTVVVPSGTRIVNVARVESPDVVRPQQPGDPNACQANSGRSVDAALDADIDQCDTVETVLGTTARRSADPAPPSGERLPETGGPGGWIGMLGGASAAGAIGLSLTGRRSRGPRGIHRS